MRLHEAECQASGTAGGAREPAEPGSVRSIRARAGTSTSQLHVPEKVSEVNSSITKHSRSLHQLAVNILTKTNQFESKCTTKKVEKKLKKMKNK